MVRLELEVLSQSGINQSAVTRVSFNVCVDPSVFPQVCSLHHGDVHPVPTVCKTARGEISQTGHCGLLDGAAAADLQAHCLHRSLSSKTTMRTCVFCFFTECINYKYCNYNDHLHYINIVIIPVDYVLCNRRYFL